jgi:hypothetical protein
MKLTENYKSRFEAVLQAINRRSPTKGDDSTVQLSEAGKTALLKSLQDRFEDDTGL